MVDEKTVIAGAPLNLPAGPSAFKPTLMQKLGIALPGMVIALLVAVGISYLILDNVIGKAKEQIKQLDSDLNTEKTKRTEDVKRLEDARKELETQVKEVAAKADKLDKDKEAVAKELGKIGTGLEKIAGDFGDFRKKKDETDSEHDKELAKHEKNIGDVARQVKYIEDKLKKLDELAADVNGLKETSATLKNDYRVLRDDLGKAKERQDLTEKDLTDLGERTRLFQLRVLAARAREAADAARQTDLKTLLTRLDDVEDKK
jgi:chromosome segregation ATPase